MDRACRPGEIAAGPSSTKLNAEVRRAIAVPEIKSKLEGMGGDPRATTPAEMLRTGGEPTGYVGRSSPRRPTSRSD